MGGKSYDFMQNGKIKATAKNRLLKSAMSEQLTTLHYPTEPYFRLYEHFAHQGIGICITGNVMVDKSALGAPFDLVLDDDTYLANFAHLAQSATKNGTLCLMQLNHPGKQSPKTLSKTPVAPSALMMTGRMAHFFNPPKALTTTQIKNIIQKFAKSAKLAADAGFSGIQIHAAHGYLISQFLSMRHNRRTDAYGNNLSGRLRFLLEIYDAIKMVVPSDFLISVKLNCNDFQKGGLSPDDCIKIVTILSKIGIDLIELSGGNYENPVMMHGIGRDKNGRGAYFADVAQKCRQIDGAAALALTGGFCRSKDINNALLHNICDFAGVAKALAHSSDFAIKLLRGANVDCMLPDVKTGWSALDAHLQSALQIEYYRQKLQVLSRLGDEATQNASHAGLQALSCLAKNTIKAHLFAK